MKKNLFTFLLILFTFQLYAADYYWVGGGGNWSDLNHWRLGSSGGSIPSIVPSAGDNVFFGPNAGFGTATADKTVTINANAFCNNMTWTTDVPNNPIFTRGPSTTILLSISGNVALSPTVTFNGVYTSLVGSTPAVLTTNGVISGTLSFTIDKPGSGLTLADNLIYATPANGYNVVVLTAGSFNSAAKTMQLYGFGSNNANIRSVNISNSTINLSWTWDYRGTNKSLIATGAFMSSAVEFHVDGGFYPVVETGGSQNAHYDISSTTFNKLTFTYTANSSLAKIANNNIVDSLFFKGSGAIRSGNNKVKYVIFEGDATIGGGANVIQYARIGGKLSLIDQAGHQFDTLITAPNKNISIAGSNTINKYFKAGGLPCDGFTEISGVSAGKLIFAAGAVVDMDNVLLSNLAAQGPNTPIAVNGIDNDGNSGFTITEPVSTGTTLYWVNGGGDWNDKTHWSTSSGGTGGACIPFVNDNVVFDANSGFSNGSIVTTSGNSYCKDMTWAAGINQNTTFNESGTYTLFVYGSIVLNPKVTMNAFMELRGDAAVTLRTNGSSLGANQYNIRKSAAGATTGLTLLDDWNNPNAAFALIRGVLDIRNRTVNLYAISSSGSLGKFLYMNKANVSVNNWSFASPPNVLDATDSYLLARNSIVTNGQTYHIVDCAVTTSGGMDMAGTTFGQLTFTNTGLTSPARIHGGNTIRRLEFKGQGMIRYGGNVIDSLITAENRNFYFYETSPGHTKINKYYKATHPSCSGLGEIRSGTSAVSTLIFAANAKVDISNVYLENIAATGGGGSLLMPIPFSGADAGGNSGWTISSSSGNARYWIGGSGDWNDASHWSLSSGGTGGACIPTVGDDVYFDAQSGFTNASKSVTVNNGNAYFHNMSWAGVLNDPVFTKSAAWSMECWGNSIVLNPVSTLNIVPLLLKGGEATVMSGQCKGDFDLRITKPGGSLTLANNYDNIQTDFYLIEGGFTASGRLLNIRSIDNGGLDNNISLDISGSTINATVAGIRYSGGITKRSLSAANSIINGNLIADGFNYNIVNSAGIGSANITISNTTIKELNLTNPSTSSAIGINGANNTIGRLEYKGSGGIYGTGNKIDTLIFFPGNIYTLTSGTNTTITGEWFGSGSPCRPTEIKSSGPTPATITKTAGIVDFDYVRLQRIVGTGAATFKAREHSTDMGGNTGWVISPYNGAAPILGLGLDLGLKNSDFPYTLNTNGFFGSPLSQYEWKKGGNIISTANELSITEPGTYSVKVMFPDGCSITDDITISLVSTDLAIIKSVDNSAPIVGSNVVFTLKATNNGPGAGTGITVTDLLPTGYTYVSNTAPVGTTYDAGTGLWTISNLASGVEAMITITAKVNATGIYVNTATISSTGDDPEPANNSSTVTIVPSPTAIITQPSCAVETGTIEVPLASGGMYSIDGGTNFQVGNIFANLATADYSIVVKIGANTSAPVTVTINEAPAAPDAPISGGNQQVCATSPIQTLTATATVPIGSTVVWYDALHGGNVVANPILNTIGTVVYYAETNNGICTSKSRTAVMLNINSAPVIAQLADQTGCTTYILPAITGTNLTGNEAYYALPNGVGLKYLAGTVLNTIGTQTLYIYDKAASNVACAGNIDVAPNASLSNNVSLHNIFSASHDFYPRAINPDFWKGTGSQSITYNASEGVIRYQNVIGELNINNDPSCTGNHVEVMVGATFKNEGPTAGTGYSGHVTIANKLTGEVLYTKPIAPDFKVGATATYSASAIVSPAELLSGNLIVIFGVETAQGGYKNWTLSNFRATYKYLSEMPCPDEKSFKLTINSQPDAPVTGGDQMACIAGATLPLTATATVPAGTTMTWYDAVVGGNVVATPTLNTVGTVTYYAEAAANGCVSANRTPVKLTLNQSPIIAAITDISSCGPLTLPSITGTNLSGNQAYYTGINKTGTKFNAGDVYSIAGETTLYAYDEILQTDNSIPKSGTLTLAADGTYNAVRLLALYPDNSRVMAAGPVAFWTGGANNLSGAKTSVVVGKVSGANLPLDIGAQVALSVEGGFRTGSGAALGGYAGQIAIINLATNQLIYQSTFSDHPMGLKRYSVTGIVSRTDLIAGNIGVFGEFKSNIWRADNFTASFASVPEVISNCPAQQAFKVNVNPIPAAPLAVNQTACVDSPVQTLTATATVPSGSTVVWYDAAMAGNIVATPTLNAVGTITYYAETHLGTCVSATRTPVVLTINAQPVLTVQNPSVTCHPSTIDLTAGVITSGNPSGLLFTYFTDATATIPLVSPAAVAVSGTYYIKGTNASGCYIIKPVVVQFVDQPTVTLIHPDCVNPTGTIKITAPVGAQFIYTVTPTAGGTVTSTADNTAFTVSAGTYSVTASNTVVPGCVSAVTTVVINATPTTAMPLVYQPNCDEATGKIEFPADANYEYSIDLGGFTDQNVFPNLVPGIYSFRSRKKGDVCIASPVSVPIVANAGRPAAPVGADQQACAQSPLQTLTATAAAAAGDPVGTVIKWYDALAGGNLITSPTLNTVGSITYYAEAVNAGCTSVGRKVVKLTITALPVVNAIADINVCGSFKLPAIAGSNLSGTQAYYTATNGGGTKYAIGDQFNTIGETTLYAYDKALGTSCSAEQTFKILIRNTTAGAISGGQTICKNSAALALTSTTIGTGSGSLKYRWEQSTTSVSADFTVIAGATLATYSPSTLNTTTWFRRTTLSSYNGVDCESDPTTAVKISVQDVVTAGTIGASQTVCNNSSPATLTSVTPATGSGTISYRWESSTTDATTGFTTIVNQISAAYSPVALTTTTWFRRVALSTDGANICESVPTAVIKITVQNAVTAGLISGDQTLCNDSEVTISSVTAGTGSGTISYRWEKSTTSAAIGFATIAGAIQADYTPAALTATTYFRRITISVLDGVACESAPTAVTTIIVQDQVIAGVIGSNQTICFNTTPAALNSTTAGTGSGTISYRWEQSLASVPAFTAIAGETSVSYSPAALTETTWFRRITISSLNGVLCESEPTALIEIAVQEATSPGSIAASQTICNGSRPEPLTSLTAGTGSGIISYRWESSTTNPLTGFATIPAATAATYAPVALTSTTYFRRIAVSTLNGKACESLPTAVATISVQGTVTAGTIGTDQVICNNTVPAALNTATPAVGSGTITYRWERSSFATTGFTAIVGATADSYSPTALTTTIYFRRIAISTQNGVVCESVPTPVVKITVQGATNAGIIGDDQTICSNTVPTVLTSVTAGSGSGTISYRWESSTTSTTAGFTSIAAAQSATYAPPALTVTTYFRRITISTEGGKACESASTNVVSIIVQDAVTAGVISVNQTICNNTVPAALTAVTAGTGSGTITYRWESSTTSATTGFAAIPGATTEDYAPAALTATTYFRRITSSTLNDKVCESAPTAVVTITVQGTVTAGTIAGDQVVCKASIPVPLTSTSVGTGSGTISYRWESSTTGDDTDFTAIAGATGSGYSPAALTFTTYFRRITISTINGVACESVPTAAVSVSPNNAPIGANQNKNTDENTMLTGQVNATDTEGDVLTYSKQTNPIKGTAVVNTDGSYTYTPNLYYAGNDSFTVGISDGCSLTVVTINVTVKMTSAPSISLVKTGVFAQNYITYSFAIKNTGNVPLYALTLVDAKLGIVSKTIDAPGGLLPGLTITVTEKYTLTQADKEVGNVNNTATVNATGGAGIAVSDVSGTAENNSTPTVTGVTKPFVAVDDNYEADANKVIKENLLVNDDLYGQPVTNLSVETVTLPKNGKLILNADGTFIYTPNPGYIGSDSYTYRIKDEYGYYSNVATVSFQANFFEIKMPTLFTPNGDGVNDTFEIRGLNQFVENELAIVNRWGSEVYRMKNYQNDWSGINLNEGTYYYLLKVKKTNSSEWVIFKGYTTIVRAFKK
ncbi:gliding motility-associated C-terminal domain-containing protein [Pedobacter sp. ok626]|uniref:Ig-like domain-containing protein n=1 Tax=Pedobacter sp. ok626 TaxID=1761882 RepID=UPI000888E6DC|nr:Ig-like domain-containing protein [Pedobacter sp. ok626]SDK71731.1 gliding motility-associated C-terminal domain-containing protein [Pedobacter sp. ok626]